MSSKIIKKESFEQFARKYWEKLVCGLLVSGERGCAPSEGEILCAYNEMKNRFPECKCNIVRSGRSQGNALQRDMFQQGDKICGIRVIFTLDASSSIEFILSDSLYYVLFSTEGIAPYTHRIDTCDLSQTMKNIENFINNFPAYFAAFETKKVEFAKKVKLKEMASSSLKACVSQMLSPLGYEWNLTDKGKYFSLQIKISEKRIIEISLNEKNFTKRIPVIPEILKNIENLLNTLPFPIDISMTKEFLKK